MSNQNRIQELLTIVRSDDLSKYSQAELKLMYEEYQKLIEAVRSELNSKQGEKS